MAALNHPQKGSSIKVDPIRTEKDIKLIKKAVGKYNIKASGGIKTAKQALSFIKAGATRIGTSDVYEYNLTGLGVGNHSYKWFANDTSNNWNSSAIYNLTTTSAAVSPTGPLRHT